MKNWRIPAILLLLLILAMTFRWHTDKTTNNGIITKYSLDRWNEAAYVETLTSQSRWETMVRRPSIAMDWYSSSGLTYIWCGLTALSASWLIIVLPKPVKRQKGESA